jgi:hypothetical protein
MKKGNKSCGMPKFETVFARGEIGRLFFNPNFEWQKSKSEKKLKSVTFSKTLKKKFRAPSSQKTVILLFNRYFCLQNEKARQGQ